MIEAGQAALQRQAERNRDRLHRDEQQGPGKIGRQAADAEHGRTHGAPRQLR